MFKNNLNQTIPVGVDMQQSIHTISTMDVYNILQDISASKLVIDLRKKKDFEQCHIKTAVNIPPPVEDGQDLIQKLNIHKYIGSNVTAKYWNLVFQRIIVYTDHPFQYDMDYMNKLNYDTFPNTLEQNIKVQDWSKALLEYFVSKRKTTLVYVYQGGFESFHRHYPFICLNVNQKPDTELYPTEIIEGFLYLGGKETSNCRKQLMNLKITYIVNMAKELNDIYGHIYKYYRADLDDHPKADQKMLQQFEAIFQFMDECKKNGERVLVHCAMGISRSATVVIAYLMKEYAMDYNTAFKFVKSKRSIISPNFGFNKALKDFDKQLQTQRLKQQQICNNTVSATSVQQQQQQPPMVILPISNTSPPVQSSL
ncbi:putative protein tyrosine phosphatase [Tieghemostelium lacteum]|uniref:Uncharacterized protein n=1 Tax=Tieghemostelium lacteum TaxID=361077 RepID=A0A151ZBC1_TIELA|nr:putative protein tyrosine phosphatase [Tieghemostelium lacteum]|eukprot:KYQ91236.1 putative protein tyrosine phosphatase [Tieghemostelium lacteum]